MAPKTIALHAVEPSRKKRRASSLSQCSQDDRLGTSLEFYQFSTAYCALPRTSMSRAFVACLIHFSYHGRDRRFFSVPDRLHGIDANGLKLTEEPSIVLGRVANYSFDGLERVLQDVLTIV